jgi:SAM-dependent methyltransferase
MSTSLERTSVIDRAIEAIAWARAPKEPPAPAGPLLDRQPTLERPSCPLCGATRAQLVVAAHDDWVSGEVRTEYAVVRCEVCAGRYTTPRFREEHKRLAFSGDYPFYERARRGKAGERDDLEAASRVFEGRARQVMSIRPRPGRLLDLGAGDGLFQDRMRRRGWSTVGMDFEPDVVWHARDRLGLEVIGGDVERDPLPAGPFDVVTMWGLLQLIYRPQRLLEKLHDVLAPGGIVAIGVSNIGGLGARIFGRSWRGLGLPRHLIHFTPPVLERLLDWSGFRVISFEFETPRWIVAGSVDALTPLPRPLGSVVRTVAHGLAQVPANGPLGDTMIALAERKRC